MSYFWAIITPFRWTSPGTLPPWGIPPCFHPPPPLESVELSPLSSPFHIDQASTILFDRSACQAGTYGLQACISAISEWPTSSSLLRCGWPIAASPLPARWSVFSERQISGHGVWTYKQFSFQVFFCAYPEPNHFLNVIEHTLVLFRSINHSKSNILWEFTNVEQSNKLVLKVNNINNKWLRWIKKMH